MLYFVTQKVAKQLNEHVSVGIKSLARLAQLVRAQLFQIDVVGSNPIFRKLLIRNNNFKESLVHY